MHDAEEGEKGKARRRTIREGDEAASLESTPPQAASRARQLIKNKSMQKYIKDLTRLWADGPANL